MMVILQPVRVLALRRSVSSASARFSDVPLHHQSLLQRAVGGNASRKTYLLYGFK